MRDIDIHVGLKYRVKEDVAPFFKRGAVVVIIEKDGELYRVQDLSKNKYLDGRWWLHYSRLEPLKGIDPEEIKEGLRVHHLYDYSKRQSKEALEELKRLSTLNEEKLDGHREGNKIIFTLVKGNKTIEASASCSPEDTFDYITVLKLRLLDLLKNVVNLQKYIYQKILKIFKLNLSKRHR